MSNNFVVYSPNNGEDRCKFDYCAQSPNKKHCFKDHNHKVTHKYANNLELEVEYDKCCWCMYEKYVEI